MSSHDEPTLDEIADRIERRREERLEELAVDDEDPWDTVIEREDRGSDRTWPDDVDGRLGS